MVPTSAIVREDAGRTHAIPFQVGGIQKPGPAEDAKVR